MAPGWRVGPSSLLGGQDAGGSRNRDAVFLVSPADFDRYQEVTGWSGSVTFDPEGEDRPPWDASGAVDCRNDQTASQPGSRGIWGIDPQTPMWCDCCGSPHPVIEHRVCRAAVN